jgi:hypothetical protein
MEYYVGDTAEEARWSTLRGIDLSQSFCPFSVYISSLQPLASYQCLRLAFVTFLPAPLVRTGVGQFDFQSPTFTASEKINLSCSTYSFLTPKIRGMRLGVRGIRCNKTNLFFLMCQNVTSRQSICSVPAFSAPQQFER